MDPAHRELLAASASLRRLVLAIAGDEHLAGLEDRVALYAYRPGYAASSDFFVRCSPGSEASVRLDLPGQELVLEGRVTDAAGLAIPGAEVVVVGDRLRRARGDLLFENHWFWMRTDESGSFRMTGLVPGGPELFVYAPGWVPSERTVDGRAGGLVECEVVLTRAGSVAGIVRDEQGDPVPGALLTYPLSPYSAYKPTATRAGPDGRYQVDVLSPGRHMLWAQDPQRSGLMSRAWVEVGPGTLATWDPVLERVEGVRVRVVDEQGVGLEGWKLICFEREAGWTRLFETGPDGRAAIFDLPPDPTIQVQARRDPSDRFPRAAVTGLKPAAGEVLLVASTSDPTGSLTGILLTEQGVPPADAAAWLMSATVYHAESEPLDPSTGAFAFERIADGTYDLTIEWGGHGILELGRFELTGGERVDRGLTRMPATGRAVIDWSWPPEAARDGLRYFLLRGAPGEPSRLVSKGPAPPPDSIDLLPGPYLLMIERDVLLEMPVFQVESGQEVRVQCGPGRTKQ